MDNGLEGCEGHHIYGNSAIIGMNRDQSGCLDGAQGRGPVEVENTRDILGDQGGANRSENICTAYHTRSDMRRVLTGRGLVRGPGKTHGSLPCDRSRQLWTSLFCMDWEGVLLMAGAGGGTMIQR